MGFLIVGLVGFFVQFIVGRRIPTVIEMQERVLRAAEMLWKEALSRGQQDDRFTIQLHNQLIDTVALAPGLSAGVVTNSGPDFDDETREELDIYFKKQAWILPYLFMNVLALRRLEFHAAPWKVRRWRPAIAAWLLMTFFVDEDGITKAEATRIPKLLGLVARASGDEQIKRLVTT